MTLLRNHNGDVGCRETRTPSSRSKEGATWHPKSRGQRSSSSLSWPRPAGGFADFLEELPIEVRVFLLCLVTMIRW
jgi:hypothetical protein